MVSFFTLNDFEYSLCYEILDQPVHLPCNHTVYGKCLTAQKQNQRRLVCPCCGDKVY